MLASRLFFSALGRVSLRFRAVLPVAGGRWQAATFLGKLDRLSSHHAQLAC